MTEEQKKLDAFFSQRIKLYKRTTRFCETILFSDGTRTKEDALYERPDLAVTYALSQGLSDAFQILGALSSNVVVMADKFAAIDVSIQALSKKTDADLSGIKGSVADLEKTILPSVKSMVQLFDRLRDEEERRKKNGEAMIA